MDTSMQAYRHVPMKSPRLIRTLTLLPSTSPSSPIDIELSVVDLDSRPYYKALSYAWGDVSVKVGIRCHGKLLQVTTNCESALRHLRLKHMSRVLWIDAICIDQTSVDEKDQQVQLMGDIYSAARLVFIWLGPGAAITNLAIAFLAQFKDIANADDVSRNAFVKERFQGLQDVGRLLGDPFEIFRDLYERSWFNRVWTLQEVALAQEAIVVCGNATIPWDVLVYAVDTLRTFENQSGKYDILSAFDAIMSAHQYLASALSSRSEAPQVTNATPHKLFTTIITRTLHRQCFEPRDRVFGLHAVLRQLGATPPNPAYGKPIAQVYAEAARLAIEQDNSLWILDFVNGLHPRENWPSWVPTWPDTLIPPPVEANAFHASGSESKPRYKFSDDGRCLTIIGTKIDVVQLRAERSPYLGSPFPLEYDQMNVAHAKEVANIIKSHQEWIKLWSTRRFLSSMGMPSKYGDRQGHINALFRILLQDITLVPDSLSRAEDLMRGFTKWQRLLSANIPSSGFGMAALIALLTPYSTTPSWLPPALHHLTQTDEWKIYEAINQDPDASLFDNHLRLACRANTFFVTNDGYMGTAPASIRQGDALILVSGLEVPLIVRPGEEAGCYRLMGPAFVQGLMAGNMWPRGQDPLEEFMFV